MTDSRHKGRSALFGCLLALAATGAWATPVSDAWVAQGQRALDARDYATARRAFERAMVADPQDARAYADLGLVNQQTGAVDKAWKYYRMALELAPNDVSALSRSARLDLDIGRVESAQRKLSKLREVCAACPEYRQLDQAVTAYKARQGRH
jgi:Flp pilus assembly protein TadD